jgi:hypothetical protein
MEVHVFRINSEVFDTVLDPAWDGPQTLILVFFASEFGLRPAPLECLRAAFPWSYMLGCSTAGEILGSSLEDHSIVVAVLRFAFTRLRVAYSDTVSGPAVSGLAGEALGRTLAGTNLKGVLVLSEGLNVNGSELVKGIHAALPAQVKVIGALAGDGESFQKTYVLMAAPGKPIQLLSRGAVAVGFRGEAIRFSCGYGGGWSRFGPKHRVTRSKGNVLFELDGQPALQLYKTYLGTLADNLPVSALFFPFAILGEPDDGAEALVRTVLATNEEDQSLTFAGDVHEGFTVQMMFYNQNRLVDGATEAAKKLGKVSNGQALTLAVTCVGRRMVMGEQTEEELEAVMAVLPKGALQVGLYSYGELSPLSTGRSQLLNQSMTLAMIREDSHVLHPMLLRQLRDFDLRQDTAPDAESWSQFVEQVNRIYHEGDQDRDMLERVLRLNRSEMLDLVS